MKLEIRFIGIIAICLLFAIANSIQFFTAPFVQPPNTVYLGTIHYYEDYFLYVNHFLQGAQGNWLVANRYTSESTPSSIIYWSNLLLGKTGGLLHLSPILSYNLSVIVLAFFVLLSSYILFVTIFPKDTRKSTLGFIFSTFATSLINHIWVNGKSMWYPFQLWRTPHYAFDRLGGAPHQLLQTLTFLWVVILFFGYNVKKPSIFFVLLILLVILTTLNPIQAGLLILAIWISICFYPSLRKTHIIPLLIFSFVTVVAMLYTNSLLSILPHLQSKLWEAQQSTATTIPFLLASIGPIVLPMAFGILPTIREKKPILTFSVIIFAMCYGIFLSPIPQLLGISNVRTIFPALYPFMCVIAVLGSMSLIKKLKIKDMVGLYGIGIVFVLLSIPTLRVELQQKLKPLDNLQDIVLFLPNNIHNGFRRLSHQKPNDAVVLANPDSHMDVLVPALSGHSTFSGHPLATINNEDKKAQSRNLFSQILSPTEANTWLHAQNIRYIVFTSLDGDKNQFHLKYSFLHVFFSNSLVTIFSIE